MIIHGAREREHKFINNLFEHLVPRFYFIIDNNQSTSLAYVPALFLNKMFKAKL